MAKRRRRVVGTGAMMSPGWYNTPAMQLNGVSPSLNYDFGGRRYYNKDIGTATTFPLAMTRNTNAMRFNSSGQIVWAPANLLTGTQSFTPTWTLTGATLPASSAPGVPVSAANTYKLAEDSSLNTHSISAGMATVAGQSYTFSCYLKAAERGFALMAVLTRFTTASVQIDLSNGNTTVGQSAAGFTPRAPVDAGNGWWRVSFDAVATATGAIGSDCFRIYTSQDGIWANRVYTGDGSSGIYICAPQCELADGTPAGTWNATTTTEYYGPRYDYNPATLAPRGLLIEDARTNDIPDQNFVSGSNMNISPGVVKDNYWQFARGTSNGANTSHAINSSGISVTTGTVRHMSIIVTGTAQYVQMLTPLAYGDATAYVNYDILNGTVTFTGATASKPYCLDLGNGFRMIGFDFTTSANAAGAGTTLFIIDSPTAGRAAANTLTTYVDVYFAFNGLGEGESSPMPTFGTAVTRAADTFTSATDTWLDQTKGTWMSTYTGSNTTLARQNFFLSDGTTANFISDSRVTNRSRHQSAVAGVASNTPITATTDTDFVEAKTAILYNTSPTKRVVMNGGTVANTAVAVPTSGMTQLNIGSTPNGTAIFNGWIKEIRYYPDASASDPQLQALTV